MDKLQEIREEVIALSKNVRNDGYKWALSDVVKILDKHIGPVKRTIVNKV